MITPGFEGFMISSGFCASSGFFPEAYGLRMNFLYHMNPSSVDSESVTGKVSQNQPGPPILEKINASGTNRTTVRKTVSSELLRLQPTA